MVDSGIRKMVWIWNLKVQDSCMDFNQQTYASLATEDDTFTGCRDWEADILEGLLFCLTHHPMWLRILACQIGLHGLIQCPTHHKQLVNARYHL